MVEKFVGSSVPSTGGCYEGKGATKQLPPYSSAMFKGLDVVAGRGVMADVVITCKRKINC